MNEISSQVAGRKVESSVTDAGKDQLPAIKKSKRQRSTPWNIGCKPWCKKYFWEGQSLRSEGAGDVEETGPSGSKRFVDRYRRMIGLLVPAIIVQLTWWSVIIRYQLFHLFKERWPMTVTMVFGSVISGMTSEGGGAVAFPVMTLLLGVSPSEARDFSIFIQAVGMSGAAFAIFFMGVQIEWHAIVISTLGGILGVLFGFHYVDPYMPNAWKKMSFVTIWFSFAFALFLLNRYHKRKTFRTIPDFKLWKGVILFMGGTLGGIFTSFAGGGVDICTFSILTLLFRVSEKTATPTSVVLMSLVSIVGCYWRIVIAGTVTRSSLEYLAVSVPIVVVGAPFGAILGSHFHRQVLAAAVYILDTVALVTAYILIPQTLVLAVSSVGIIAGGFLFFFILTKLGEKLLERREKKVTSAKRTQMHTNGNDLLPSSNGYVNTDCPEGSETFHNQCINESFIPEDQKGNTKLEIVESISL